MKATTESKSVYYTRGFELISRRAGSAASYYIYDGGLSVRALTNEAGTVTDTLVFDAFGNETAKTGSTDNSYGFQGEEKDETEPTTDITNNNAGKNILMKSRELPVLTHA